MRFHDYIETHQVFTVGDVYSVASRASAKTLLNRALASGKLERVRRGIYVSKTGKFAGESPDPFRVLAAVDPEAVVSYHSALTAHGVAHSVLFECTFRSSAVRTPFEYGGMRYVPYDDGDSPLVQVVRAKAYGSITATTREQTLLDCLTRPGRAGGIEEAIRSCSAFPYVDTEVLVALLGQASATVAARVGWLLEAKAGDWGVGGDVLARLGSLLGRGPAKLDPRSRENRGWSGRWRLYLPEGEGEVASWVS